MDTKQQIQEWSKLYGRAISGEELAEINANLSGFLETLKQWSDDEERKLNEQSNDKRSILLSSAP